MANNLMKVLLFAACIAGLSANVLVRSTRGACPTFTTKPDFDYRQVFIFKIYIFIINIIRSNISNNTIIQNFYSQIFFIYLIWFIIFINFINFYLLFSRFYWLFYFINNTIFL